MEKIKLFTLAIIESFVNFQIEDESFREYFDKEIATICFRRFSNYLKHFLSITSLPRLSVSG